MASTLKSLTAAIIFILLTHIVYLASPAGKSGLIADVFLVPAVYRILVTTQSISCLNRGTVCCIAEGTARKQNRDRYLKPLQSSAESPESEATSVERQEERKTDVDPSHEIEEAPSEDVDNDVVDVEFNALYT